jgi:hypothetical protein
VEITDRASFAGAVREALVRLDGNVSRAVYARTMLFISLVACVLVIIVVAHVSRVEHNLLQSTALDEAAKRLREVDQFRAADLSARVPADDARVYKANPTRSPRRRRYPARSSSRSPTA